MKKLYEKSEIGFAVAWIIVYVVGSSGSDAISAAIGMEKLVTLIWLGVLAAVLWRFIRVNGLAAYYGLCRGQFSADRLLFYIPLAVLATVNVWFGIRMNDSVPEMLLHIGSMLLVGFLEEVIFRGLLFKATSRENVRTAIIVSSVTFGIGHIVNLLNGSGAGLVPNLCQIFYAVAIGFVFVVLFHRGKSLWPCIVTHGVLNALSTFSNSEAAERYLIPVSLALAAVSVGYAVYLMKKLPTPAA